MAYDIAISSGLDPMSLLLPGTGSRVDGVQKMVQRFVFLLLNDNGSVLGDEDEGTSFLSLVRSTGYTVWAVQNAFILAAAEIQSLFEDLDLPDDEQLQDVELQDVYAEGSTVYLRVGLTSVAGQAATTTVTV